MPMRVAPIVAATEAWSVLTRALRSRGVSQLAVRKSSDTAPRSIDGATNNQVSGRRISPMTAMQTRPAASLVSLTRGQRERLRAIAAPSSSALAKAIECPQVRTYLFVEMQTPCQRSPGLTQLRIAGPCLMDAVSAWQFFWHPASKKCCRLCDLAAALYSTLSQSGLSAGILIDRGARGPTPFGLRRECKFGLRNPQDKVRCAHQPHAGEQLSSFASASLVMIILIFSR